MADCVFLGLHGLDGEDGKIQATLDLLGIPYTGSGYLGSAMAMDKAVTKRVMDSYHILTPKWREYKYKEKDIPAIVAETDVPCVVKTVSGGSSIGVVLPLTREELEKALHDVLAYSDRVIIEDRVFGREMTVPVLGDRYLDAIEIVPPEKGSFDYTAKYQSGAAAAKEICPADITEQEHARMGEAALRLHRALGLSVYSRADFILDEAGNAWCLEINTLPGLTPGSLLPKAARTAGYSYEQLCQTLVDLSMENFK